MSATILLVEDDEIIRRLFGRVLRGGGYTVLEAGSGEAAEVLCRERNVDLVVSDVCMSGKTGPQLGVSLRRTAPQLLLLYRGRTVNSRRLRARTWCATASPGPWR